MGPLRGHYRSATGALPLEHARSAGEARHRGRRDGPWGRLLHRHAGRAARECYKRLQSGIGAICYIPGSSIRQPASSRRRIGCLEGWLRSGSGQCPSCRARHYRGATPSFRGRVRMRKERGHSCPPRQALASPRRTRMYNTARICFGWRPAEPGQAFVPKGREPVAGGWAKRHHRIRGWSGLHPGRGNGAYLSSFPLWKCPKSPMIHAGKRLM